MDSASWSVYNASKKNKLSSDVTVVDCAGEPFKLMKVLLDGLAQNSEACFWLRDLQHGPQIVRIFPLDFVYLDKDGRIIVAAELPPGIPIPRFHPDATSALILPFNALARKGAVEGDRLVICTETELENQLVSIASEVSLDTPSTSDISDALPAISLATQAIPFSSPPVAAPVAAGATAHASAYTLSAASTWQVSTSTTAAVLLDQPEVQASAGTATSPELLPAKAQQEPEFEAQSLASFEAETTSFGVVPGDSRDATSASQEQDAGVFASQPRSGAEDAGVLDLGSKPVEHVSPKDKVHHSKAAAPAVSFDSELDQIRKNAMEARLAASKEAAEKQYVKVMTPKPLPKSKKATGKKAPDKDHLGTRVIRWLNLEDPAPERRKIIRLLLQGLHAYDAEGGTGARYEIRDICPPGIYLRTDERWCEGDVISLVIETAGATDDDHRVRVKVRVIRCDDDGYGMAFEFPEGTEFQPWNRVKTKRSDETEAQFILRELRLSCALGFMQRLCPNSAEELRHALLDRLSNKRVASAVAIALRTEQELEKIGRRDALFVHPEIAMRIVEGGSWIEDSWIRELWSGLLTSSCTPDGLDRSNLTFIDILAKLTPIHLRLFSYICDKGIEAIVGGASEATLELFSEAEELMEAADSHSFPRIQQSIVHLSTYGLLVDASRPSYVALSDRSKIRTTPTSLGLQMYARCNGRRDE